MATGSCKPCRAGGTLPVLCLNRRGEGPVRLERGTVGGEATRPVIVWVEVIVASFVSVPLSVSCPFSGDSLTRISSGTWLSLPPGSASFAGLSLTAALALVVVSGGKLVDSADPDGAPCAGFFGRDRRGRTRCGFGFSSSSKLGSLAVFSSTAVVGLPVSRSAGVSAAASFFFAASCSRRCCRFSSSFCRLFSLFSRSSCLSASSFFANASALTRLSSLLLSFSSRAATFLASARKAASSSAFSCAAFWSSSACNFRASSAARALASRSAALFFASCCFANCAFLLASAFRFCSCSALCFSSAFLFFSSSSRCFSSFFL
mmetsp:Transcript_62864/g.148891  ORF Transcript_62864/g.148891 Transcript_62864/m.148891 type:complete len:319 (-) Transcript_62864:764-1720(-)